MCASVFIKWHFRFVCGCVWGKFVHQCRFERVFVFMCMCVFTWLPLTIHAAHYTSRSDVNLLFSWFMCVCVCVCVFVHIHTHIHIHTPGYQIWVRFCLPHVVNTTFIHVYIHAKHPWSCTHTFVTSGLFSLRIYIYIYICMYVYIHIHIHTYIHTYIHIYVYIHTYIYIYIYIYTHTYIYKPIHTHVHMYTHAYIRACIQPHMDTYICMDT